MQRGQSVGLSWALAGAVPLAFVLPLYAAPRGSRDAAATVWWRIAISSVTACCLTAAAHWLQPAPRASVHRWVGVRASARGIAQALALSCAVYAGNIAQAASGALPRQQGQAALHITMRNLVASPLIEELVFRAVICQILLPAGVAPANVALCSPLLFSAAHLHHMLWQVVAEKAPLRQAAARQAFQLLYTCLFGAMACALYTSSGSIWGPCTLHLICNWQGVPAASAAWRQRGRLWQLAALWFVGGLCAAVGACRMLRTGACQLVWC